MLSVFVVSIIFTLLLSFYHEIRHYYFSDTDLVIQGDINEEKTEALLNRSFIVIKYYYLRGDDRAEDIEQNLEEFIRTMNRTFFLVSVSDPEGQFLPGKLPTAKIITNETVIDIKKPDSVFDIVVPLFNLTCGGMPC